MKEGKEGKYEIKSSITQYYLKKYSNIFDENDEVDLQKNLYHYSSNEAIMEIIKNKCLHLTHSQYMNDPQELSYGYNLLFKEPHPFENKQFVNDLKLLLEKTKLDKDDEYTKDMQNDFYLFSTTTEQDNLYMWKMYNDLQGSNFGLITDVIIQSFQELIDPKKDKNDKENEKDDESTVLNKVLHGFVVYDKEEQVDIINKEIEDAFKQYSNYTGKDRIYLLFTFLMRMEIYFLFFKNECFKDEKEYRIVFPVNKKSKKVKFKSVNGVLKPYIEVKFNQSIEEIMIDDIMLGPHSKSKSIRYVFELFLKSMYHAENISLSESSIDII